MDSIRRTFFAHVSLYVCTSVSSIVTATILGVYGITPKFTAAWFFLTIFLIMLSAIIVLAVAKELFRLMLDRFPANPLQRIASRLIETLCAEDRIGNIFHSVMGLIPVLLVYAAFKGSITRIHPFSWDMIFFELDRYIGFGQDPFQYLQPVLGYPSITTFLSLTYYAWFFVLYGCLVWQGFSKQNSNLRMQFLVSLSLAFFLAGCVLATLFSSAGPCYFSHLNLGFDPYAVQIEYLRSIEPNPPFSVLVQDSLWEAFSSGKFEHGVSAMPSMHVTIAVIIGLLGWRRGGLTAFTLPTFAFLIVLGSVHLAWHYASDAIAGIGLATLFWYAAGKLVVLTSRTFARPAACGPITLGPPALSGTEV